MNDLQYNFNGNNVVQSCLCNKKVILNNEHLFYCEVLNEGRKCNTPYIKLFNGTLFEQRDIVNILDANMRKYETFSQAQEDP